MQKPARGKNEIRAAIKAGNAERVRALLSRMEYDPNPLLAIAVQNYNTARKHAGHAEIVDLLLASGARADSGMLLEAARDGSQAIVDRLVVGGAELNIFASAALGDPASVAKLLRRDRRLAQARTPEDTAHYRQFTPLHCCCLSGLGRASASRADRLLEVARRLAENGADLNAAGKFYGGLVVTPMDMLAHTGGSLPLGRFLINHGAKVSGFAFLEALSHRGRSPAEGFALAELFLETGFDVNSNAWKGDGTPLHATANAGAPKTVQWLLEHGADVNARGRLGRTPLHLAAERNTSSRTVEILLASGADTRARDDEGLTPLDVANQFGKSAVASCLKRSDSRQN